MKDAGPGWLDAAAARRNAGRASASYDAAAVLQAEVRDRMLGRLDWIGYTPESVLDLGCGTGRGAVALARRWPRARVVAVDFSPEMLGEAARADTDGRCKRLCADALALPLPAASADLVFSNLMLPWCEDLDAAFAEVARVLRPRGLFTFSTFGPDTLVELREAWGPESAARVMPFIDMHDVGDALVHAGLAEPVLDVSRYTLTYPDLYSLMRDLRAAGSQNALADRPRGLTGRARLHALEQAYEQRRRDGVLPATYEVVYGQAWGTPAGARRRDDGDVVVPVGAIGRRGRP